VSYIFGRGYLAENDAAGIEIIRQGDKFVVKFFSSPGNYLEIENNSFDTLPESIRFAREMIMMKFNLKQLSENNLPKILRETRDIILGRVRWEG
jgi:hypothetical protein